MALSQKNTDSVEKYKDLIPEDGIPVCGFRLASYINGNGETCYRFTQVGDISAAQLIGLLELVKLEMASSAIVRSRKQKNEEE